MKQRRYLFLAVLWLAVCPAARSEREDTKRFFHDTDIRERLVSEGQKLIEAGKVVKVDDLAAQLGRKQCVLSLPPRSRRKMSSADIYRRRLPSVLVVAGLFKCEKCTRWHCDMSSGFLITTEGAFVTNYHTIANKKGKERSAVVMTSDGAIYPIEEVLAADKGNDLAILKVAAPGQRFQPAPLSTQAPVGTRVTVISHPLHRAFTLTQGIISRYYEESRKDGKRPRRVAITADFAKGSSGAPVFNEAGNVVSVASSTSSVYYTVEKGVQKNLQMVFKQCVPVEALLNLIQSPKDR